LTSIQTKKRPSYAPSSRARLWLAFPEGSLAQGGTEAMGFVGW
jgi:hypothetical protein